MTTVPVLARRMMNQSQVDGILRRAVLVCLVLGPTAVAQERPVHWLHAGAMPPGAIGSQRLLRDGPLSEYFQPVRIRAPKGARIALASEEGFSDSPAGDMLVGMQIAPVYRLRVTDIPNNPGLEIFPTVEVIDRLYPPPGLALRYPIPVELTQEELELAARGSFVTRVIYVEDPSSALPIAQPGAGSSFGEPSLQAPDSNDKSPENQGGSQPWVEALPGADPLVEADERGRPVAILRMGGRVPNADAQSLEFQGAAPFVMFDANDPCLQERNCEQYGHEEENGVGAGADNGDRRARIANVGDDANGAGK
jgi:hypothetical protein